MRMKLGQLVTPQKTAISLPTGGAEGGGEPKEGAQGAAAEGGANEEGGL